MLTITEEYERRNLKIKNGKKDENVAFYSNDSGKGRKGGSGSKKDKDVECFNCHKKGHKKPDCWAPGGGKEGQGPNQKGKGKAKENEKEKETAATAKEKNEKKTDESEEAWMVGLDDVLDKGEGDESDVGSDFIDDLFENQSDNQSDCWLTDSEELTEDFTDEDLPLLEPNSNSDSSDEEDEDVLVTETPLIPLDDEVYSTFDYEVLTGATSVKTTDVDLYNSGATRHMSGLRHRFINLELKPITTADKRTFSAIGQGDMYVYLPHDDFPPSRVLLKNVLYAPDMGVTLVSISRIAAAGSTVVFAGDTC